MHLIGTIPERAPEPRSGPESRDATPLSATGDRVECSVIQRESRPSGRFRGGELV